MSDPFKPLGTAQETNPAFLFYGPPGTGKTHLAYLLLQKMLEAKPSARALWFDVDRKLASDLSITPEIRRSIDVWEPKSASTMKGKVGIARVERYDKGKLIPGTQGFIPQEPTLYTELVDAINNANERVPFPWDLVVLDTMTTAAEHLEPLLLYHHQASAMTMPLWGIFGTNLFNLRNGILYMPCTKIIIAHTRTVETEIDGAKFTNIFPSVPGQQGEKMAKDFNEVYYFEGFNNLQKKWLVLVRASRMYQARTSRDFGGKDRVDTDTLLSKL